MGEDMVKETVQNSEQILTEKEQDRNNTFNIIIGVSTLLIAILGATFAYFSATATSRENDVTVRSAYVSISYDGGTEIKASNLIPATQTVAISKFQKTMEWVGTFDYEAYEFVDVDEDMNTDYLDRRCIDSRGRQVCYVYQFTISSDGVADGETGIAGYIKVNKNQFENLSYMLFEVTFEKDEETGQYLYDRFKNKIVKEYALVSSFDKVDENPDNAYGEDYTFATFESPFDNFGENKEYLSTTYPVACLFGFAEGYEDFDKDDPERCAVRNVKNQVSHTYQLLVWLHETGKVQPEQGMVFQGTVALEVPGGADNTGYDNGKITGQQ